MIDNLVELVERYISNKQKKIIVFGTGEGSKKVTKLMETLSIKISYYVDNDSHKCGKSFLGSTIQSPQILYEENKPEIVVVIASMFYEDISFQLKRMGFVENVHFFYGLNTVGDEKPKENGNKEDTDINLKRWFEKIYCDNLNFYNSPLQARKWIKLLEDNANTGMRIKKNLYLSKSHLGFTFCSNSLGLRGPADIQGKGVIFGTSFAMGFSVDDGFNWYDKNIFSKNWLNLGLPVGSMEIKSLYKECYKGDPEVAIVLYHPNFWVFDHRYENREKSSMGLFQYMNWKTEFVDCLHLTMNRYNQFKTNIEKGKYHLLHYNEYMYFLDGDYAFFDPDENTKCFHNGLKNWQEILSDFKKVFMIRIPVKENIACNYTNNHYLNELTIMHTKCWTYTKEFLGELESVTFLEPDIFTLDDYLACDSHWNEKGNSKFSTYIIDMISKCM